MIGLFDNGGNEVGRENLGENLEGNFGFEIRMVRKSNDNSKELVGAKRDFQKLSKLDVWLV